MSNSIGILTAGGDSPGLNAAIRALGKTAISKYDMRVTGFRQGFRGLMQNRTVDLHAGALSGILTMGGTILGTSRDKPHKMPVGDKVLDMTDAMLDTYQQHHLDVLVCLGGGGTMSNAWRLAKKGMNIITLPKTIDNDVYGTDVTFGFDTALSIATEAIDRLHSTAHSHHRIIIVEVMGHNTGWLALGSGLAGGADVILIPEVPYDIDIVADSILRRSQGGKHFSIIALSEGAFSADLGKQIRQLKDGIKGEEDKSGRKRHKRKLRKLLARQANITHELTKQLEDRTRLEARVTTLGHVQRGGAPTAADRLLATRLGTACAEAIQEGVSNVMIAARNGDTEAVPLQDVVGKRKTVPQDHIWIETARALEICLGDQ
ncbi:MAG: ATP-dependent 6-phosphofructokinase [Anaerolineaceae bacterium]|nr:ATP-dependent 6-phosphofructokinase [Anaerolineaceae bacterium]